MTAPRGGISHLASPPHPSYSRYLMLPHDHNHSHTSSTGRLTHVPPYPPPFPTFSPAWPKLISIFLPYENNTTNNNNPCSSR